MTFTINELRNSIFSQVYEVYQIFQNHFGEEYTDLQEIPTDNEIASVAEVYDAQLISPQEDRYEVSEAQYEHIKEFYSSLRPCIYVWWPEVTVTNENDKSIKIQDLFAKIEITMEGRIPYENRGFKLGRSTFSEVQFSSGYVHSHVPKNYHRGDWEVFFHSPCLGTGPINNTIMDLKNNSEELVWMLFCQELSLYVTVESLAGGPYIKLEELCRLHPLLNYNDYRSVRNNNICNAFDHSFDTQVESFFRAFIKYYLAQDTLKLCFINGRYQCGMPYYDYMVSISNAFIGWYNQSANYAFVEELYRRKYLIKVAVSNGRFCSIGSSTNNRVEDVEGMYLCTFKGREIKLKIMHDQDDTENPPTLLLNYKIAMYILENILRIINYHYRNENRELSGAAEVKSPAPTFQAVYYI